MENNNLNNRSNKVSAFAAYNGGQNGQVAKLAQNNAVKKAKPKKRYRKNKRPVITDASVTVHTGKKPTGSVNGNLPVNSIDEPKQSKLIDVKKKKTIRKRKIKPASTANANSNKMQVPQTHDDDELTLIGEVQADPKKPKRKKFEKSRDVAKTSSNNTTDLPKDSNGPTNETQAEEGVWKLLNQLNYKNSALDARTAFDWLIGPTRFGTFFEQYWEKKPLHVQRDDRTYYDGLFTFDELDKTLREHDIQYTVNLDITKYENGERKTLNPVGRAYAPTVWDFYNQGCSVRLLNPQTYSKSVWKLNSTLQELFGTFVGANLYLTPANTQGFAPHYDDIEAFVVQLEGIKRWRIYKPRNNEETLPRFSSRNFKPHEVGKPIMEVELRSGDLLYFSRGFIHEAVASKEEHSLHMTISTTQKNTYGDFLQLLMDQAIQTAMAENIEYRRALPLNYMDISGTAHMDNNPIGRKDFLAKVQQLMKGLIDYASIDDASDQMAKTSFMQDSLPPCLNEDEKRRSIHGRKRGAATLFTSHTKIRLMRKNCLRLVMEKETDVSIYYNTENSRVYREKELQHFLIKSDLAPGVDFLIENYPTFVSLKDLPLESEKDKMRICQMLYDKALLIVD